MIFTLSLATTHYANSAVKPLNIAKISFNPKKQVDRIQPFGTYLAEKLSSSGYTHANIVIVKNSDELINRAKRDNIQLVTSTAATAQKLAASGLFEPIALRWKKGTPEYASVIVTNKDNTSINSLEDLKGKRIVFEDFDSTTGFTIPAGAILKQGYTLEHLSSPRATQMLDEDNVGFLLGRTEETTFAWVAKGLADAGAFSDADWSDADKIPAERRKMLKKVWESNPIPRAVILASTKLTKEERSQIKTILFEAHTDLRADYALRAFHRTTKFEAFTEKHFESLKEVSDYITLTGSINK